MRSVIGETWRYLLKFMLFAGWLAVASGEFASRAQAEFPPVFNTQSANDVLTPPAEALKSLQLPPGFQATLFAAEPAVQQPVAITTDERGRLWVVENYTYAESKVGYELSLRDRIVILEDTDGDGRHDKRTVFWDEGQRMTSVEIGFGGVWVLCAPQMLFIPDANRDDVPDGPPQVLLDGFDGNAIRHNIVNGLKWGPDGWLYGRHGITTTSYIGKPGATESQRTKMNCGIWRYHPTQHRFEVVCWGTTNPWGFDYDDHGQMFFINTVIGHLWHVVPGAHYRRMFGVDFDRHTYQLLEQTADHFHWDTGEAWSDIRNKGVSDTTSRAGGGHAHSGMMIYLGNNWPAECRNRVFTLNLHGQRLNQDALHRHGAGYVGKHEPDFAKSGDPWFRGIELIYGPDGAVYVADWSDVGECHENDGVHRTSGRIFKLSYGTVKHDAKLDLSRLSNLELVALQTNANDWFVRQARRLLQERAAEKQDMADAQRALIKTFESESDVRKKLRAMWALNSIGSDDAWLLRQLEHAEEHVRVWAIRLLLDAGNTSPAFYQKLTWMAERDESGLVQLFVASAMQRLPNDQRWTLAEAFTRRTGWENDPVLPLMVWYGIEPAIASNPARAVALARTSHMSIVRKHVTRRLAEELETFAGPVNELVEFAAASSPTIQADVLHGMSDALRGWRKATSPAAWPRLQASLAKEDAPSLVAVARDLSVVFGDGRAIGELKTIVNDGKADVQVRRNALRTLVENKAEGLLPMLQKLVSNRELAPEAVRGLAYFDDAGTPKLVIDNFSRFAPDAKSEAINTLVARAGFAQALLEAVAKGRISRHEISAYHARQIRNFESPALNASLLQHWGEVRPAAQEKTALMERWKNVLTPETLRKSDPSLGRVTFQTACATCHVLYGQGRKVGPDLTGSNRKNLDYLLENVLDPSATVAVDFRTSVAVLKDGRTITGVLGDQNERTVTLETQKERVTLARDEIEELRPTAVSLMPDGLLNNLTPEQVRDLMQYLMSSEQISLPAGATK